MRVLVCGSRFWNDARLVTSMLDGLLASEPGTEEFVVIDGHAAGPDRIAHDWAEFNKDRGVNFECYPANWKVSPKGAGPIRNRRMLKEGRPTLVIGFTDDDLAPPSGTYDMMNIARAAKVPVVHINHIF
jgi:YspA, cpYpsA-related SLOG family